MATSSVEFMRHSSVQIRGGAPDYQNYLCSCNNVITRELGEEPDAYAPAFPVDHNGAGEFWGTGINVFERAIGLKKLGIALAGCEAEKALKAVRVCDDPSAATALLIRKVNSDLTNLPRRTGGM